MESLRTTRINSLPNIEAEGPHGYLAYAYQIENPQLNKPCEDAEPYVTELSDGSVLACVADGITRSSDNGVYPDPSPARDAADIARQAAVGYVHDNLDIYTPDALLTDAIIHANTAVSKLNEELGLGPNNLSHDRPEDSYGVNDYAGTTLTLAVVIEGNLHFAHIGDSPIFIYGEDGMQMVTDMQTEGKDKYCEEMKKREGFDKNKWRSFYRAVFRNNKSAKIGGKRVGYGALTGTSGIERFIESGAVSLTGDEQIIVASDGIVSVAPDQIQEVCENFQHKPEQILPTICGMALCKAEDTNGRADDMSGVLLVPNIS